jgi:nucleoside-diphosphate-sugar epimerase
VQPISLYYDVNVGGAENLLYALKKHTVKRLIFTSTVAVYGLNAGVPDEDSTIRPFNDYGKSKYKSETIFNGWADSDPTNCLITVRPTVIFGVKNQGNVYNLLHQLSSGKFIMVGKGHNRKSMGYVLNLTKFLVSLLKSPSGQFVYNYADKPDLSMNELIQIFYNTVGGNNRVNLRIPYPIGLIGGYCYDILAKITGITYPISSIRIKKFCADTVINTDKMKKTGFYPSYTLVEGLSRMIKSEFL